jgi:hypothetical protein
MKLSELLEKVNDKNLYKREQFRIVAKTAHNVG